MFFEQNILLKENKIKQKTYLKIRSKYKLKKDYKNKGKIKILKGVNKTILIISILFILFFSFFFFFYKNKKRNINNIPIAFSLNDNYVYPIIVVLTSILFNSSSKNFFTFYLLLSPDVQENSINKILDLRKKYQNCQMKFINLGNKFSNYNSGYYKTSAVFYRLELSNLISDVNKIIYLDADIIVHKDITDLYNLDMGNFYYLGFPGHDLVDFEFNGTRNFINSGCMLVNLKKLRESNAPKLFQDFYQQFGTKKYDEYIINSVFYNKISFLPLIYGIPDFGFKNPSTSTPEIFLNKFQNYINYTVEDMEYASKNRVITHGCYEIKKWWDYNYDKLTNIGKQWLFYASKSNVFDEICQKYNQFEQQCIQMKKEKIL